MSGAVKFSNGKMSCCNSDARWNCLTCAGCEREWCVNCQDINSFADKCNTCKIYMTCTDCMLDGVCSECLGIDVHAVKPPVLISRSLDCLECVNK